MALQFFPEQHNKPAIQTFNSMALTIAAAAAAL